MKIYTYDCTTAEWREFVQAMRSGNKVQIDQEMYDYWLGVLPPIFMNRKIDVKGTERYCGFGFAEGQEPVVAFWTEGRFAKSYFCQETNYWPGEL